VYLEWYQAWCTAFVSGQSTTKEKRKAVPDWGPRHGRPRPHCSKPGHFADPCHLLECDKAPSALLAARTAVLSGTTAALDSREDLVKLVCNTLVGKASQVPALRCLSPTPAVSTLGRRRQRLEVGVTSRDALALVKKATKPAKKDSV
jgi:hypothetical protein